MAQCDNLKRLLHPNSHSPTIAYLYLFVCWYEIWCVSCALDVWWHLLMQLLLNQRVHDESSGVRHVRRMFHPGRGLGGPRARRTNMHFTSSSTGGLSSSQSSSYSPSNREAMDPIAGLSRCGAYACVKQHKFHIVETRIYQWIILYILKMVNIH